MSVHVRYATRKSRNVEWLVGKKDESERVRNALTVRHGGKLGIEETLFFLFLCSLLPLPPPFLKCLGM
jgi:hypothetical protein